MCHSFANKISNDIKEDYRMIPELFKHDESLFPMDSFPDDEKKKKRQIIRTIYPESADAKMPHRAMIDLDGTIHRYSKGYQDGTIYDDAFTGAKEVIDFLKRNGYEIVIFTTRASKGNGEETNSDYKDQINQVADWLDNQGIDYDKITGEKLAADFYIDDKAIHINNGNWDAVLKVIKKRMKFKAD